VPDLATALLFHKGEPMVARRGWLAPWVGASAMHPEHVLCNAITVPAWRRAGYAVNVWTVDDPALLRQLAAWGVDGVFTNDPAAARAAMAPLPA
jgi:glycerophosphoryl diester phosphodiesterase